MNGKPPFRKPAESEIHAAAEFMSRERFTRGAATVDCNVALALLNLRLADNADLYLRGDLQDQRDAVADTLLAIQGFLSGQGFASLALAPLQRPVEALVERQNNSLDPLFAERIRSARPRRTLDQLNRMGILAALASAWLDAYSDDGRPQRSKLADAMRVFKGPWFSKVTTAQLKTARDLVSQEASDHPAVEQAARYKERIAQIAGFYGAKNAIPIMVKFLNECPPSSAFGNWKILKTPGVSPTDEE